MLFFCPVHQSWWFCQLFWGETGKVHSPSNWKIVVEQIKLHLAHKILKDEIYSARRCVWKFCELEGKNLVNPVSKLFLFQLYRHQYPGTGLHIRWHRRGYQCADWQISNTAGCHIRFGKLDSLLKLENVRPLPWQIHQRAPLKTPVYTVKRGCSILVVIAHRPWVLVRTASMRRFHRASTLFGAKLSWFFIWNMPSLEPWKKALFYIDF